MSEPRHTAARPDPSRTLMNMGAGPRGVVSAPKERANRTWPTLKRLWSYLRRQRFGLVAVFLFTVLSAALSLVSPYLLGKAIDQYILLRDTDGLVRACLLLLGVYTVGAAATWLQSHVMISVSQRTVRDLRNDLFAQLQRLPLRFFDNKTHGDLMSRTTNDIENITNTLNQSVTQIFSSFFLVIGSLAIMLSLSPLLTLVCLVSVPVIMFVARAIARQTHTHFAQQQKTLGTLNGLIEETISGQKVVKAFRREASAIQQFQASNLVLRDAATKALIYSGNMGPAMNTVNNLTFTFLAGVGGWLALSSIVSVGTIASFLNYSRHFGMPVNQLANQFNLLQSAVAGAERVFEIIDTPAEAGEQGQRLNSVRGEVVLADVSFGYKEGVPVLRNVSLTARPGEMIALVGPTGAGKTTIVNLLTRFYEVDEGRITIDGADISSLDKHGLRSKVGIVLQDAYLFAGTIRDNIRYGRLDATDAEVEHAARLANADGFVRKLAHGYETQLSAEGSNLSHGQRQLLTIARAVLANPAILILDEATSGVDTRTEMHIQSAMRTLMQGRTSFVIAHRLSTIRHADQILVIDGGRIIERGTHEQLLAQRGFYHDLYTTQFTRGVDVDEADAQSVS